ncbi:MAG: type II toxin-antitoxin system RelE/ParE family toxin [Sterolibacteriaceae bacterium]|jgi:phage-related protein|uniref:Type II toxin-antitoxin system RelE/ParE family toxin n=1 Tax=Candidatus Methylophosphatis roskildensis TaxID=2899263 RepID=A0A9D7HM55_9PROT|nr:type II toxin-antitoxin system RelE/ParE family toxin [Candidatus Methylophosphatis roskildensis]MBK7236861.1 type II toxin-antitoxin system RelE/ParE family toxin [Sterolibacteriaceae bacterium]
MSIRPRTERPLHWVGSSKRDLLNFPAEVVDEFGYELGVVQMGGQPPTAKPWKGEGAGVFELVENFRGDAFRAAYTVRFAKAVYVLHCFQKKSPSGIHTAKSDIDLIHERLKTARNDYEVRYGKED